MNRRRAQPQGLRTSRGQVLMVVVVVMLILLVMAIFLFDLHNVVRIRARSQNAADAAALTAAAWQGRTLNMIGELNLLKAATVMLTSFPPPAGSPPLAPNQQLLSAAAALTELQVRLAYVGPLVGFAAAQQAAKHNGMRNVSDFTDIVTEHVTTYLSGGTLDYSTTFGTDPQGFGFAWLPPYHDMLLAIAAEGVAASPVSNRFLCGIPILLGDVDNLLMDPAFYRAVEGNNYCWFYQRGLGPGHPPINLPGITYQQNPSGFFPGSEFLPLYLDFATGAPQADEIAAFLAARSLTPLPDDQPGLPDVRWAIYDKAGDGYGWDQTGAYTAVNPYLRNEFRSEYTYSGACARFMTTAQPDLLTGGHWSWKYGSTTPTAETALAPALPGATSTADFGGGHTFSSEAARLARAEARMADLRSHNAVISIAAAKPFGAVHELPPQSTGIILPVFTDVRLVPCVVARSNPMSEENEFYRFIIEYFGNPSYPAVPAAITAKYARYLTAIANYNDPASLFNAGWLTFDSWRTAVMAGKDARLGTADDQPDPCEPVSGPGGGGGGGSGGGPGIIH